jgi:hypothetical protein
MRAYCGRCSKGKTERSISSGWAEKKKPLRVNAEAFSGTLLKTAYFLDFLQAQGL